MFTLANLGPVIISHIELIVVLVIHRRLTLTFGKHLSSSHHELRRLLSLALTLVL